MSATDAVAQKPERLMSIDALRGFDMFWIVGGRELVLAFVALFATPLPAAFSGQFDHTEWIGFTFWDIIMPLFLFITGASMPFSFSKRIERHDSKFRIYGKIVRRTLILFVLGIVAQGNLLEFDLDRLHLYCNTLQSIAIGYFVAAILLLNVSIVWQLAMTALCLVGFWILMMFVPVPGIGSGVLEPGANLALYIDTLILGRFRDGTPYTWILSSMTFAASVLLGVMAGHILRSKKPQGTRLFWLTGAGVGCLALGWVWGLQFPIIKHIWTSSMTLWAAGWSFLMLAAMYAVIDVLGFRKWAFPFAVIGMNAIAVYMATHLINFGDIAGGLVWGLADHAGVAGDFVKTAATFALIWLILLYMYRKKTFIRV
ncbi:MAG: DUF5009 domain-containing protein [Candidatus Hydrogenedentales bacterium]